VEGRFRPGDRVVSTPGLIGADGMTLLGYSNDYPGGFAQSMLLSEMLMLPVPNGLSAEHAALTEPLAVGEHAVAKAGLAGGEVLMVVGLGPVGLAVIDALKARGLGPIIAADFSAERRAAAERMGAERIVDPAQASPHAAWAELGVAGTRGEAMMAQMMGQSVRQAVIFECVGIPGLVQSLAQSAPDGARIVVVGVCMETDRIEPLVLVSKETELRFVLGYSQAEFAASLARLAEGRTRYPDIVTDVVGLAEAPEAFVRLQTDKRQIKILVKPNA
jgi:threonine dehydrogenase-like Zn-dependent dehydrogenase